MNKISIESKNTFNTRTKSAMIYIFYWIGFFLLSIFSDPNGIGQNTTLNGWASYIPSDIRFIIALILIIYLIPILFLVSREISNCFFKKNLLIQTTSFFLILLFTFIPTILYLLPYYGFFTYAKNSTDITIAFSYSIIAILLFSFIICLITLVANKKLNWFNGVFYPLLVCGVGFFFLSSLYLSFIRGWTTILFLFSLVSLTDVFAYVGGMLFGKHKLCPKISPKKTWEGAIASLIITTLVMLGILGILFLFPPEFNVLKNILGVQFSSDIENNWVTTPSWWISITFIIIVLVILSMVGDLSFSWIKRKIGIKDFSNILPGHGGILDRIDSLSFVIVGYVVLTMIIAGFSDTSSLFPNVF